MAQTFNLRLVQMFVDLTDSPQQFLREHLPSIWRILQVTSLSLNISPKFFKSLLHNFIKLNVFRKDDFPQRRCAVARTLNL